jgi:hypothetical protein
MKVTLLYQNYTDVITLDGAEAIRNRRRGFAQLMGTAPFPAGGFSKAGLNGTISNLDW